MSNHEHAFPWPFFVLAQANGKLGLINHELLFYHAKQHSLLFLYACRGDHNLMLHQCKVSNKTFSRLFW